MRSYALMAEIIIVFLTLPVLIVTGLLPKSMVVPSVWMAFIYVLVVLRLHRVDIFTCNIDKSALWPLLYRMGGVVAFLGLFCWLVFPEYLFRFVTERPYLWGLVVFLYPLISVIPQEITFRLFFQYRYAPLFGEGAMMIFANAVVFSYIHIVFENMIAVIFTFVGGLLFSYTYAKTRSVLMVSVEHALYGNAIYTLGLGMFFYHNGAAI